MILSFHPCFSGDRNILCAGRFPDAGDRSAIQAADAVVLPQGCSRQLYEMARQYCDHVFPDYDARFRFPGKMGQLRLFRKMNLPHPKTRLFESVKDALPVSEKMPKSTGIDFPWVFKLTWGGEGEAVFLVTSMAEFEKLATRAMQFERSGQKGFLIQAYIPTHRSLRIVRIGETFLAYWRVMADPEVFGASLASGAKLDPESDPERRQAAISLLEPFCEKTGINLAGFDALFPEDETGHGPFFIEINYFFGRAGLGGSDKFYRLLDSEIRRWLYTRGLGQPHEKI